MDTPTCHTRRTDHYLKFTDYTPVHTYTQTIRAHGGSIQKPRRELPVVEFFCQKCGCINGHSVPEGWQPPAETATDEELRALGEW